MIIEISSSLQKQIISCADLIRSGRTQPKNPHKTAPPKTNPKKQKKPTTHKQQNKTPKTNKNTQRNYCLEMRPITADNVFEFLTCIF